MKGDFRHDINLHHIAFAAVAVVTQVAISNGEPLFHVDDTNNLDVSDDDGEPEELVDEGSDVEDGQDGQDGSDGKEEHDDSTAEEHTHNDTYEEEEFFVAEMM